MGIKGASVLCTQPSFNLCTGVVIDAMHCIFLGLMEKTLMGFWFGTSHRGSPYSIKTKVNVTGFGKTLRMGSARDSRNAHF